MSMDKIQPSDELVDMVRYIADVKETLPFPYRGLLNIQGVYYQSCVLLDGRCVYRAGGKFIPKLTFTLELDGSITIQKYKPGDWEYNVELAYKKASELYELASKETGRRWEEEERKTRINKIYYYEKMVRKNPVDHFAWGSLALLYEQEGRYKDMENALKKKIEAGDKSEKTSSWDYKYLGKTYLSALSNSIRDKGIPIWGYIPSRVTVDSLGYTIEEVQRLAKENLEKARALQKLEGYEDHDESIKEVELAYKAADELSNGAFEKYDNFQSEKRAKEACKRSRMLEDETDNEDV